MDNNLYEKIQILDYSKMMDAKGIRIEKGEKKHSMINLEQSKNNLLGILSLFFMKEQFLNKLQILLLNGEYNKFVIQLS